MLYLDLVERVLEPQLSLVVLNSFVFMIMVSFSFVLHFRSFHSVFGSLLFSQSYNNVYAWCPPILLASGGAPLRHQCLLQMFMFKSRMLKAWLVVASSSASKPDSNLWVRFGFLQWPSLLDSWTRVSSIQFLLDAPTQPMCGWRGRSERDIRCAFKRGQAEQKTNFERKTLTFEVLQKGIGSIPTGFRFRLFRIPSPLLLSNY